MAEVARNNAVCWEVDKKVWRYKSQDIAKSFKILLGF
jgi:hypothetical protein